MSWNSTQESAREITPDFLPVIPIMLVMAIVGEFGNGFIIFSTVRHKSLHGSCNILIAINALADIGHQTGVYVLAYYILSGTNYTSQETCWYLQMLPNFFYHIGIFITFLIGVDRLACISIPLKYRFWNDGHQFEYLFIMITIPTVYGIAWLVLAYNDMILAPDNKVVCVISSFIPLSLKTAHFLNNTILDTLMIIVYTLTWICMKFKKGNFSQIHQVMKSLTVIMCIIIISWPISTLLFKVVKETVEPPDQQTYKLYVSILLNIGLCVNFFVYFTFSKNYREAFRQDLAGLFKKFSTQNQINIAI